MPPLPSGRSVLGYPVLTAREIGTPTLHHGIEQE